MNCVVFVFIGAWIRFPDWTNATIGLSPGRLAAFFLSILFIRRVPVLMLLYKTVPDIATWQEALFCGWFGPMGVVRQRPTIMTSSQLICRIIGCRLHFGIGFDISPSTSIASSRATRNPRHTNSARCDLHHPWVHSYSCVQFSLAQSRKFTPVQMGCPSPQ